MWIAQVWSDPTGDAPAQLSDLEVVFGNQFSIGLGGDTKAGRDGKTGAGHLAQIRALAANQRDILFVDLGKWQY